MRSDFSLLTKCFPGKAIGNLCHVKHLHYDETSNKGTEMINVVFGVLTNNKKFRTICLAGDIIREEGTSKCQSAAIVDLFTECVKLLKGWCNQKK